MTITFSEPIVCVGDNDSGQHVVEEDWFPHEEPRFYPGIETGWGQATWHPGTPVDRRSMVPRPFTPGIEYAPFTITYTYDWSTSVPPLTVSEITVTNPLSYISDPAEKTIARNALNGNSCMWISGQMNFNWAYWHDSIYGIEKKEWKLTRAPQYADWIAYLNSGPVYGYLPATPPQGLPHMADLTRVNTNPPPALLYGIATVPGGASPQWWVWERHFIKGGWSGGGYYYAVPMQEIGVLQPTHLVQAGMVNILEPASKSVGSIGLNPSNPWDLVFMVSGPNYSYFASGTAIVRPDNYMNREQVVLRSSVKSTPTQAIGPVTNPIEFDSVPPDVRKYPVDGYPSSRPYQSFIMDFSNNFAPGSDETMNAWWNGRGVKDGYYFVVMTDGRQFSLRLVSSLDPYKLGKVTTKNWLRKGGLSLFQNGSASVSRNSLVTPNLANFPESNVYWQQSGRTWHCKTYLEEQGDYERFSSSADPLASIGSGLPLSSRRFSGRKPPIYIGAGSGTLATWLSGNIPCGKSGVIELRLQGSFNPSPPGPGQKRIGPISLPQIAYLDIGDSGVD